MDPIVFDAGKKAWGTGQGTDAVAPRFMQQSTSPLMEVRAIAFLLFAAASLGAVLPAAPCAADAAVHTGKKPRG